MEQSIEERLSRIQKRVDQIFLGQALITKAESFDSSTNLMMLMQHNMASLAGLGFGLLGLAGLSVGVFGIGLVIDSSVIRIAGFIILCVAFGMGIVFGVRLSDFQKRYREAKAKAEELVKSCDRVAESVRTILRLEAAEGEKGEE